MTDQQKAEEKRAMEVLSAMPGSNIEFELAPQGTSAALMSIRKMMVDFDKKVTAQNKALHEAKRRISMVTEPSFIAALIDDFEMDQSSSDAARQVHSSICHVLLEPLFDTKDEQEGK